MVGVVETSENNLVFSLEAWPEAGLERDFALTPAEFGRILAARASEAENLKIMTSARGHVKLRLIGKRLRVKGFFAVKLELLCDRCLSPFVSRVQDDFEESLNLVESERAAQANDQYSDQYSNQDDGGPAEASSSDSLVITADRTVDLSPLLAEFFWLAWPSKALCQPDCAGLCPKCGANLNEGACYCSAAPEVQS